MLEQSIIILVYQKIELAIFKQSIWLFLKSDWTPPVLHLLLLAQDCGLMIVDSIPSTMCAGSFGATC